MILSDRISVSLELSFMRNVHYFLYVFKFVIFVLLVLKENLVLVVLYKNFAWKTMCSSILWKQECAAILSF